MRFITLANDPWHALGGEDGPPVSINPEAHLLLDLVQWQIRIAAGETIKLRQELIPQNGCISTSARNRRAVVRKKNGWHGLRAAKPKGRSFCRVLP